MAPNTDGSSGRTSTGGRPPAAPSLEADLLCPRQRAAETEANIGAVSAIDSDIVCFPVTVPGEPLAEK